MCVHNDVPVCMRVNEICIIIITTFQWMIPSIGRLEPTWAKAVIIDTGSVQSCLVTMDAIGKHAVMPYHRMQHNILMYKN